MIPMTPSTRALDVTRHWDAEEAHEMSTAATAHRDLVARIQAVDGCSEQQAEDDVRSFENAFREL